jgi:outer membrane protein OmpA-like peptidoglycan-associated protein
MRNVMGKKNMGSNLIAIMFALGLISIGFVSAAGQDTLHLTPRTYTDGEKAKVEGVIAGRNGDIMTVRDKKNAVTTAVLNGNTKVETPKMLWRKEHRNVTDLIPGLWVTVKGKGNSQGQLMADKVTFDKHSMQLAQTINGGVAPLEAEQTQMKGRQDKMEAQQVQMQSQQQRMEGQQAEMLTAQQEMRARQVEQQNQQQKLRQDLGVTQQETDMLEKRVSELDDYEVRHTAAIGFATGRATLTPEAILALDDIAEKAMNTRAYLIEVAGFADSTGGKAFNQQLSRRRAEAVVAYLEEVKRLPLRRMLTPAGLGTSQPVADNSTAEGRALNRRVEVKILVNRGLAQK